MKEVKYSMALEKGNEILVLDYYTPMYKPSCHGNTTWYINIDMVITDIEILNSGTALKNRRNKVKYSMAIK